MQRYYTYARKNVRFFVLDSNPMDPAAAGVDGEHAQGIAG